jgi:hypothetical protein
MREGNLARFNQRAATNQCGLTDRVMRKPKRPRSNDAGSPYEQSGNAIDLRDFERFVQRHRRQN